MSFQCNDCKLWLDAACDLAHTGKRVKDENGVDKPGPLYHPTDPPVCWDCRDKRNCKTS